jgi:hypothetical protein
MGKATLTRYVAEPLIAKTLCCPYVSLFLIVFNYATLLPSNAKKFLSCMHPSNLIRKYGDFSNLNCNVNTVRYHIQRLAEQHRTSLGGGGGM